ncbi:PPE domain-containing protein [Mycolicibacterium goodii]|uniref:PPE domain-containing protein n=1 Tax=Mycolicibacterium goodii TaxID=134601 RepID=UPI001BDD68C0|nr:PPE domain-containing protein [Mycolicibacterium goodii]MBU8841184.1 PPE family protein [Mycolicibacterium goodii]
MVPSEPWVAYLPEFNAIRRELGPGAATWLASGSMWSTLASMVAEAAAAFAAELAAVGINWQGLSQIQLAGAVPPFMAWLGLAEGVAAANALAAYAVAEADAIARGTMIPTALVSQNRISELIAEATNFFGINSGLIAFLNGQYAGYWTDNAATMLTYDEAVQLATVPKPISPPPPLANALAAAAQGAESTALAAANQGAQAGTQAATQAAQQPASTAAQAPASAGTEMVSTLLGSGGQLLSAPTQALGSGGSSLTEPLNSIMQPFQSLLGQFGGSTQDAGAFIAGPPSSAFPGANAAFSGNPVGGSTAGGGGVPFATGGGIPAGSMLANAYPHGNLSSVKSQDVFTGVPSRGPVSAASFGPGAMPAGGGMAPMMHGPGNNGSSSRRESDAVLVANVAPAGPAMDDPRRV